MSETALIDAVFLTNTSRDQALKCISHLREPEIASIVVVDNASTDDTVDVIRADHPDVTVVALDRPSGISAALNRGAEVGTSPYVLYLNDDVFAAPGSVRRLLDTLCEHDDAVAAGGRLCNDDLTTQDRYRPRSFPTPVAVVARLLGLDRVWPRNPLTGRHLRHKLSDEATVAVDQPAGACMLVRRPIAERIGGWDERFWFWYEDVDLSRRLALHGTQLYVPSAPFKHIGGSTVGRMTRAQSHRCTFHGILLYAKSHFSGTGRALVALALVAIGAMRALMSVWRDREAARMYVATAREALALLAGRRVVGLQDVSAAARVRPVEQT
jgi:GT2 family glycosyltransferase